MKSKTVILFFILCATVSAQKYIEEPEPLLPLPSVEQMEWYKMEMNAFVHFTTNTFTGKEWGYGDEKTSVFNPTNANVEQWIHTFKNAGFKGVILTTKHHDGFCLWPSKYTEHSVKNSPYKNGKGDIVKEVSDGCKKFGLKFGIYLSPWDRNNSQYGTPAYIEYYRKQLIELVTNYGPAFEIWLDGANGGDGYYGGANEKRQIDGSKYYDWPATISLVKKINPHALFFSDAGPNIRWVGNENGIAGETNWNTISVDTLYAGKSNIENILNTGSEDGKNWVPAETDVSIRPGWFYHKKEDSLVKTPEQLFNIYLSSVGRGSTLLLNIPPDRNGRINEHDIKSLKGFRKMLDSEFKNNLVAYAKVKANNFRGNNKKFSPQNVLDKNFESYWTTDDSLKTAEIEIDLTKPKTVKYILLQEYIKLGQRIRSLNVEAWIGNSWKLIANATTVGYKRILKINPVKTNKVKISITDSRACPLISTVALY